MLKNTVSAYGLVSITVHWLSILVILSLTALGLWMVELDYYDPWYKQGPDIHRAIGVLFVILLLFRTLWRWISPPPAAVATAAAWEVRVSHWVHRALLLLLWAIVIAGYLISTADGRAVDVFGWFELPATLTSIEDQEEVMGDLHFILAMVMLAMAAVHALAAIKHHFIDRDRTLLRMFGRS